MMSVIKCVDARMVSVHLSGYDPIPVWRFYNMHSTGTVAPERAEMRWENGELIRLAVYGRRLKVDGSVGNAETSTQFVQDGRVLAQNAIPDWLDALVKEFAP